MKAFNHKEIWALIGGRRRGSSHFMVGGHSQQRSCVGNLLIIPKIPDAHLCSLGVTHPKESRADEGDKRLDPLITPLWVSHVICVVGVNLPKVGGGGGAVLTI